MLDFFSHWNTQKNIIMYLAGGMPVQKRLAFEIHLSKCAKCRELLEIEKQFNSEIRTACEPLSEAWSRTCSKLEKLHDYYDTSPKSLIRRPSQRNSWNFLDWEVPRSLVFSGSAIIILILAAMYYSKPVIFTPYTTRYTAKVSKSLGNGIWTKGYREEDWHQLTNEEDVISGDKIRTDEFSRGLVHLAKGRQVWLNHSTQITLLSDLRTAFEVNSGEVYVALHNHNGLFQVKTPDGTVRVYGTEFQISVDTVKMKTMVYCFQNTVYFDSPQGKVVLPAGYASEIIQHGAPSEPALFDLSQVGFWKTQFEQLSLLSESERSKLHQSFINHGDLLFDHKSYDQALKFYHIAVLLDPNDYIPYYGIGRVYRELGQYGLATSTYRRMIEISPNENSIVYQLAVCLIELKKYHEAEQALLPVNPFYQARWVLLGNAYLFQHQLDKAEQAFNQAQTLGLKMSDESNPQIHGGLAEIARQRGDMDRALNEITYALKSDAIPSLVYAEAAWVYHAAKKPDDEKDAWNNYLKLDPHGSFSDEARKRLTDLNSL